MVSYGRFNRSNTSIKSSGRRTNYRRRRFGYTTKKRRSNLSTFALRKKLGVERKYLDKALHCTATLQSTGYNGTGTPIEGMTGASYESRYWYEYNFATDPNTPQQESGSCNLMQGVFGGSNAVTRIGNKVDASYIRGNMTVTAMKLARNYNNSNADQSGETTTPEGAGNMLGEYCRTTIKVCMVLDKQAWSAAGNPEAPQVTWGDVFSNKTIDGDTGFSTAGVHSELNIDNMGRFIVLKSWMIELDATDPQKTFSFYIPGKTIGKIRYKGSDISSRCNKGISFIWSSLSMGVVTPTVATLAPSVVMNSRFAFTDL